MNEGSVPTGVKISSNHATRLPQHDQPTCSESRQYQAEAISNHVRLRGQGTARPSDASYRRPNETVSNMR
eukprot:2279889-Pleurochrysis_carterae.AAC.2